MSDLTYSSHVTHYYEPLPVYDDIRSKHETFNQKRHRKRYADNEPAMSARGERNFRQVPFRLCLCVQLRNSQTEELHNEVRIRRTARFDSSGVRYVYYKRFWSRPRLAPLQKSRSMRPPGRRSARSRRGPAGENSAHMLILLYLGGPRWVPLFRGDRANAGAARPTSRPFQDYRNVSQI